MQKCLILDKCLNAPATFSVQGTIGWGAWNPFSTLIDLLFSDVNRKKPPPYEKGLEKAEGGGIEYNYVYYRLFCI